MFEWHYDQEDGVYKSAGASNKLLEQAAIEMQFVQFTGRVDAFGKGKGDTVTIHHYNDLDVPANGGELNERTRIPIDPLSFHQRSFMVAEFGRGAEYTNLAQQLGKYDPDSQLQKKLKKQMAYCLDITAAAAFKSAKVKFIPTSLTGGVWDTDGIASTLALNNITMDHLAVIRDYMATDLHVPFYDANSYAGLATTKFLRGIKDDPQFQAWMMYLRKGDVVLNSEAGRAESIRFVEVTHHAALNNAMGTGGALGEAVIFGEEAVARAEVLYPHLRANPNYQDDFGRRKALAWYGVIKFATWWDTANDTEAKIVHVTSAPQ